MEEQAEVVEERGGEEEKDRAVDDVEKQSADVEVDEETNHASGVVEAAATEQPSSDLEHTGLSLSATSLQALVS